MIIVLKKNFDKQKVDGFIKDLEDKGLSINYSEGANTTIVGLIGDTSKVDMESMLALDFVENVARVSEPYKQVNRKFHSDDTIIKVGDGAFGGGEFSMIAGPCSVESESQMVSISLKLKEIGAKFLRGGAFKPRTSPYAFQGLGKEGVEMLVKAKKESNLPIVTELMGLEELKYFDDVDIIQVGARNMQNFQMLKELGKIDKPILLKRGLSSTIEEFLMSAEYILAGGNRNVILCERGIRTFERMTRNTLDISAVPLLKRLTHLPVIVDPSHATGLNYLVLPMSKASVVSGADGLMIEVHENPEKALCDGAQSITPVEFKKLYDSVMVLAKMEGKNV